MSLRAIPETPEGYLARAKAVHKLGGKPGIIWCPCGVCGDGECYPVTVGELLHAADVMGA